MSDLKHQVLWVRDLKMHEVNTYSWNNIKFFAPLEHAFRNHRVVNIKGRIGRFTGTYSMGLDYYNLKNPTTRQVLFKLDRKTFIDRNANGKLLDEALLLFAISIGVRSKKLLPITTGAIGYASVSNTLKF